MSATAANSIAAGWRPLLSSVGMGLSSPTAFARTAPACRPTRSDHHWTSSSLAAPAESRRRGRCSRPARFMPNSVSAWRQPPVSRYSAYSPARRAKIMGQAHRGPVDHDAKQMLRTERNRCRHTVAWSPSREHWPRAVCRNTGSVMCAGEGTTTGTAPRPCAGLGEGLPAGLRRSCPGPIAQRHAIHRTTTWCIGMT